MTEPYTRNFLGPTPRDIDREADWVTAPEPQPNFAVKWELDSLVQKWVKLANILEDALKSDPDKQVTYVPPEIMQFVLNPTPDVALRYCAQELKTALNKVKF